MSKFGGSFRTTQWDPLLLISQIIAIQSLMYCSLGLFSYILDMLADSNHSLDHLFVDHIHVSGSMTIILAYLLNSFVGSLLLYFIVKRTKLCLDFSCSYHLIHLVVTIFYNYSFPFNVSWFLLNALCATNMCVISEFLCMRSEMREIPVGYSALSTKIDL